MKQKRNISSAEDVLWEVWFQDMFDRGCPREAVASGKGIAAGLTELWSRHLYETVRENGTEGFSRFNLWLKLEGISIEITGSPTGAVKLREWVFGGSFDRHSGNMNLLGSISETHWNLMLDDRSSEGILSAADESENLDEFRMHLIHINR